MPLGAAAEEVGRRRESEVEKDERERRRPGADFTLGRARIPKEKLKLQGDKAAKERPRSRGSIVLIKSLLRDRALRLDKPNVCAGAGEEFNGQFGFSRDDLIGRAGARAAKRADKACLREFLDARQIKLS